MMYFSIKCEVGMCLSPRSLQSRAWGTACMLEDWEEGDPKAWRVRAKGKWGRAGGEKIKDGTSLPGWPRLRRKTQSLLSHADCQQKSWQNPCISPTEQSGDEDRGIDLSTLCLLLMVRVYPSELCYPNTPGSC